MTQPDYSRRERAGRDGPVLDKAGVERVGICWVDAETFWWDATNAPHCPACGVDDEGYADKHGFFVAESIEL